MADYREIKDYGFLYYLYNDPKFSRMPFHILTKFSTFISYFGIFLFLMKINLNQKFLVYLSFFGNLIMSSMIFALNRRFGADTTAYINQAGQFASGQTNYSMISSMQGPCFYPAGHLWHYLPIYKMFTYTCYAETIL